MQKGDLGRRLVAYIIDYMVFNFITSLITVPFYFVIFLPLLFAGNTKASMAAASSFMLILLCVSTIVMFALLILATYVYFIWVPAKKYSGATLGKYVLKMRVVKMDGSAPSQTDLFLREVVGKFVSGIVFCLGYIWVFIDEKGQGWHDKIADTMVIDVE